MAEWGKKTGRRFEGSLATVVPETFRKEYSHMGPGYYTSEDPNRPSLQKSLETGYFPSMYPRSPRMAQDSMGIPTELQRITSEGPVYPHISPGCYGEQPPASMITDPKATSGRLVEKSSFLLCPDSARIAETLSPDQRHVATLPNRFDHKREAELAWSHGGRLPQAGRFDSDQKLTPKQKEEATAKRLVQSREQDKKFRGRVNNIHKYGVPVNQEDAVEDSSMSQHGLYNTIMLNSLKLRSAHSSTFNSQVPKLSKCPFDLKTELQFDVFDHIGPGYYNTAHDFNSIRYRTTTASVTERGSAAFASRQPRFSKRPRRELTNKTNPRVLAKEIERRRAEAKKLQKVYTLGQKSKKGSLTAR